MSQPTPEEGLPEELAAVEALVRAAGDYVAPSDDLRPRVLETIRHDRRVNRRASRLTLSAAAALATTLAASWQIAVAGQAIHESSTRERVARLTAEETTLKRGVDPLWALVDALFAVRQSRAESLGGSPRSGENVENPTQSDDANGS